MAIETNIKNQPVSWIIDNDNDHNLNYNISMQRREIWNKDTMSNLIVSLILDVPIENLLFEKETAKSKKYKVIDGKQRVTTICKFSSDKFKISKNIDHYEFNGEDIRGKKYSELSVELQKAISEKQLTITIVEPLTADEREMVFFMRNQSVPLSKIELSRARIGEAGMTKLDELTNHPFISNKIQMAGVARKKYHDMQILIEYLILKKDSEAAEFTPKAVTAMCEELKHAPNKINVETIKKILDFLNAVVPNKNKNLRKIIAPMLMGIAEKALEDGVAPEKFTAWVEQGLYPLFENEEFKKSFKSYKNSDVQTRVRLMEESYAKFLDEAPDTTDETSDESSDE